MKKYNTETGKVTLNKKFMYYDIIRWNYLNFKIRRFLSNKNKTVIQYKNIVENPAVVLIKISQMLNLDVDESTNSLNNNEFQIIENHLVHGNRFRKQRGLIELKKDNRPFQELNVFDDNLIRNCTWFNI